MKRERSMKVGGADTYVIMGKERGYGEGNGSAMGHDDPRYQTKLR